MDGVQLLDVLGLHVEIVALVDRVEDLGRPAAAAAAVRIGLHF